jgi:hypothetical protein
MEKQASTYTQQAEPFEGYIVEEVDSEQEIGS